MIGLSFTSNNVPDIGVNPINGLLIVVRTMVTENKERQEGKRQVGIRTKEKCRSETLEERGGAVSRRIGENGGRKKRDREREREREMQKKMERKRQRAFVCLFGRRTLNTWSRCTHGSYGLRLEK